MKELYEKLELTEAASLDDVKKSYRKLAMKYHPDKNGGDDSKFKEISEAYEILSNPDKRSEYERESMFTNRTFFEDSGFNEFIKRNGFSDAFDQMYGWSKTSKARDIMLQLNISLEDAYFGTHRNIKLGLKDVKIDIPKGVKPGQKLRLKGLGQRGFTEDLNGDLIVLINIFNHPTFTLTEKGLYKNHEIDIFDAILGGKSSIDVFDKKITFNIPKNTQNNAILRVQGKGFPVFNQDEKYGDIYLNINVTLPTNLSSDEIELIENLKTSIKNRSHE